MHEQVRVCGDGVERSFETYEVNSPIGNIMITACARGLHKVCQSPDIQDSNFSPDCSVDVEFSSKVKDTPEGVSLDAVKWLQTYFHDSKEVSYVTVPQICCINENGPFQERVLLVLLKNIPFGQVISYSELAELAGSKGAQQSVGTAMAKNPIQLIIPCHRVVKTGNKVGKYSSGCRNSVKVWLLNHEGFTVSDGLISHK